MKKNILLFLLTITIATFSCKKFDPDDAPLFVQINDFVWKGMNTYYLWQNEVPALGDNRFKTEEDLFNYLEGYDKPELLFEALRHQPDVIDKWSWIVDDYEALEAYFSGVRKTSGAKIKLHLTAENSTDIYGYVRYIIPGSNAAATTLERGAVFNSVNGQLLTTSNYKDLIFNSTSFTLDLGTYFFNTTTQIVEINSNNEHVTLTNGEYAENPVHKKTVFEIDGQKIGYIMYNSFTSNYNNELNDAFQYLKGENVTDLILDLRYNGGGSVQTSMYLSSMITGQFDGQIYTEEKWNPKIQEWMQENHPDWLVNHFSNIMVDNTSINNLNLDRVIVITTDNSASASELVINALKPYIDVVTIGTT
ncbi:MAG TPA: peptidase S41, partial [Lutibacter sp.]|nr:peptidase S41 [Lutibacter sp.]